MTQWSSHQADFAVGDLADLHDPSESPDAVDAYFECITTCSLDDAECITVCTTKLRDHN